MESISRARAVAATRCPLSSIDSINTNPSPSRSVKAQVLTALALTSHDLQAILLNLFADLGRFRELLSSSRLPTARYKQKTVQNHENVANVRSLVKYTAQPMLETGTARDAQETLFIPVDHA